LAALRKRRIIVFLACALALLGALGWLRLGRLPEGFLDLAPYRSVRVTDREGRLLYESLSQKESRSGWLAAEALPQTLVNATLAAEDHRFFYHPGIDPLALSRALWRDLRAMKFAEGGSTLTQQVAKQLMNRKRGVGGKLKEMLLALRLEHRLPKRAILALYLNLAPYGNQYAGAQAAALGYFGVPASSLTPAQAAFLAGLPQSPTALDPYRHIASARKRQKLVLSLMRRAGFLDQASYENALNERLAFKRIARPFEAPHFVEKVLAEAGDDPPQELRTTLDLGLQREVEGILSAQRKRLLEHGAHNVAVVVLDNASGEWLAWEGSGDYFDPEHGGAIDGAMEPRQPGSALKPFTYALAFERGFSPASVLPDVPSHFPTAEQGISYSPRNYDGTFRGPLRARSALAGSVNVPAVWLLSQVGVANLLERFRACGFTTFSRNADYYGYGLTLGDAEVRLDELCAAYSALARGGLYVQPKALLGAAAGKESEPRRVFTNESAYYVTDIISDASARAFVFGHGGSLDFPFPVAAKTGTSQAYHDNWTIGYTREVTVGVWVGNFDHSALTGSSGVTGAGPIFHDVMLAAEKSALGRFPSPADPPLANVPAGFVPVTLCALSGLKATGACPTTLNERLAPEDVPPPCSWHALVSGKVVVDWPAQYQNWALAKENRAVYEDQPGQPAAAQKQKPARPVFAVTNPPDGAIYLIDPTLRPQFQALPLRVAASGAPRPVVWEVDGVEAGRCRSDEPFLWPLKQGEHRASVRDAFGNAAAASFIVK
jgi:penicillin-binding protein 1C